MKKVICTILIAFTIIILAGCGNNNINSKSNENNTNNEINEGNENNMNKTSLVVYFSATGTTKKVAEKIAKASNSDIIEIIPKEKYTSVDLDYNNDTSRANKEQNSSTSRPIIANEMNVDKYDKIYLGYPI